MHKKQKGELFPRQTRQARQILYWSLPFAPRYGFTFTRKKYAGAFVAVGSV
jgi:hypothetical protein